MKVDTMRSMRFDLKLSRRADELKLTQRDVAKGTGVSHGTANTWFTGKRVPDMPTALKLARLLNVPLDYLADDEADNPPAMRTDDERVIDRLVQAIGAAEAIRRLTQAAPVPRSPDGLSSVTVKPRTPGSDEGKSSRSA